MPLPGWSALAARRDAGRHHRGRRRRGAAAAMLEAEGVVFLPDGRVDMAAFIWERM